MSLTSFVNELCLLCVKVLTSSTVQKESHSVGNVGAQYKYKNAAVDVKVDTQSNVGSYTIITSFVHLYAKQSFRSFCSCFGR